MKLSPVVSPSQMRRIEKLAIDEGCNEESFMKEAGKKVSLHAGELLKENKKALLILGKGNKGGDALVAGIDLLKKGFDIEAISLFEDQDCSFLQKKFRNEFRATKGKITKISSVSSALFTTTDLIIDGLLGTGFQGEVVSEIAELISFVNSSKKPVLAIDIPSGLDGLTGEIKGDAIHATRTVTLGMLKLGFFLKNGWNVVGDLFLEDFGLPVKYFQDVEAEAFCPLSQRPKLPLIQRNRHKYQAGYVVGLSGSKVFKGAPKLSGLSALRTGAGLVRIFHLDEIGESPYSLICQKLEKKLWKKEIKRASSVFIGPGVEGLNKAFLINELPTITAPLVCDAGALDASFRYPPFTVLTPHRGEALKLLGLKEKVSENELIASCQRYVDETNCLLVLKGAPTWIFSLNQKPLVLVGGDPGMAKAGSGDVLTGVIAALLAQKMDPLNAAILGVQLHFQAGKIAAEKLGSYSLIAEDLIDSLANALKHLQCNRGCT